VSDAQIDTGTLTETEQVTVQPVSTEMNSTEGTSTEHSPTVNGEADTNTGQPAVAGATASEATAPVEAPAQPTGPTAEELAALAQAFTREIGVASKSEDGTISWETGVGIMGGEDVDSATGAVPDGVLSNLKAKFLQLPSGPARKAVREWVDGWFGEAVEAMDATLGRTLYVIKTKALTGTGASASPTAARQPVDPTDAFVDQITALYLAPYMVEVPEKVAQDWGARVEAKANELNEAARTYAAWATAVAALPDDATDEQKAAHPEPEVPEVVKNALRLARGRTSNTTRRRASSTGTSTGTTRASSGDGVRRNVANHIANAFADKPVGTFLKVSEIVNTRSDEYGDVPVSPGAVSARLFPSSGKCTVPGVEGATENGAKGGRKVA
jgi:hypothetical protein